MRTVMLLQGLIVLSFLIVIVSQIAIPLIRGTPMFPFFRTRQTEKQIAEARAAAEDRRLQQELRGLRKPPPKNDRDREPQASPWATAERPAPPPPPPPNQPPRASRPRRPTGVN